MAPRPGGNQVDSQAGAKAFGLEAKKDLRQRGDAGPTTPKGSGVGCGCGTIMAIVIVALILLALVQSCRQRDEERCSAYSPSFPRASTGGWSGRSSGGSHK